MEDQIINTLTKEDNHYTFNTGKYKGILLRELESVTVEDFLENKNNRWDYGNLDLVISDDFCDKILSKMDDLDELQLIDKEEYEKESYFEDLHRQKLSWDLQIQGLN